MRVGFHTFGCKLNQHETEALASAFLREGFAVVRARDEADLYVVNTCTVTSAGDHKARALVRSLLRERVGSPVIVTGCSSQLEAGPLAGLGPDVVVVGQDRKSRLLDLPTLLRGSADGACPATEVLRAWAGSDVATPADPFAFRIDEASFHTRAFLKVQDGCDRRCAYCRVPLARGPSVSIGADEAARRATDLEDRGFREIVVTGVNVSAWREAGPARPACSNACSSRRAGLASASPRWSRNRSTRISRACSPMRASAHTSTCRCSPGPTACWPRWAGATRHRPSCGPWSCCVGSRTIRSSLPTSWWDFRARRTTTSC